MVEGEGGVVLYGCPTGRSFCLPTLHIPHPITLSSSASLISVWPAIKQSTTTSARRAVVVSPKKHPWRALEPFVAIPKSGVVGVRTPFTIAPWTSPRLYPTSTCQTVPPLPTAPAQFLTAVSTRDETIEFAPKCTRGCLLEFPAAFKFIVTTLTSLVPVISSVGHLAIATHQRVATFVSPIAGQDKFCLVPWAKS